MPAEHAKIVVLPGDGIGPEVAGAAKRVLSAVAEREGLSLAFSEELIGGAAIQATGEALPARTLEACLSADAILLGAVGAPEYDDPGLRVRPEQGLLAIRKALGLYANLRPVRCYAALVDASPIKAELLNGVDLVVVRELTGGLYFGQPRIRETKHGIERAVDTMEYTAPEVERIVELAFELARARRRKLTSVDKANVLESSRLWREVTTRVGTRHSDVELEHQLVDSCAMRLITHARDFDVIVTENTFGDILTDEAAVLTGSLGMLPSASLGSGKIGLYEPIHGSAPDLAGQDVANPIGAMLSSAMLLRHSLGRSQAAAALERAVERALDAGARTRDLGGSLGTLEITERVLAALDGTI
ncbi:MAG: 3-isopropylmalate dehydrogenase [Proteobacteria bacterium]|nr:3-isopropylmalate dehydrogenase [Pseudomonadota bacterium]